MLDADDSFRPIGVVRSPLSRLEDAPKQGFEGAPDAWLDIGPQFSEALQGISVGDAIVVLTWLGRARRDVLKVHPRDDPRRPLTGVFATRSADRPNPIGLHRVTVRGLTGASLLVGPLEAIDGTPVLDLKPSLRSRPGGNPSPQDGVFQRALSKLLIELFEGPPGSEAYVLNPGDRGLLRELDSIPAQTASATPGSARTSIASHADHVHYGLTLLNRWSRGESDPFAGADYGASWRRTTVSEDQWRRLRDDLRREAEQWKSAVTDRAEWD